ncbi:mediator of RNA polymerase II transcription subunit 27-like [Battus philenor]|uniref:mediator of RNA polymerase II transcription subunit 27-like n=1 Tax=Battus philenor TaxID=42288 RepID=UPI0035D0238B
MNQVINQEQLNIALRSFYKLRVSITKIFRNLTNNQPPNHENDEFDVELQVLAKSVNINLRELERIFKAMPIPPPFNIGKNMYITQETIDDREALHTHMVNVNKLADKIQAHSSLIQIESRQNYPPIPYVNPEIMVQRDNLHNNIVVPFQGDKIINKFNRSFKNMDIKITNASPTNTVVSITLGRVLKALVSFKGMKMEWVIIKSFAEKLELYTESDHYVFRRITNNAHAAMLYFYSRSLPEKALCSFLTWFHSYINLYKEPCKRCRLHMHRHSMLLPVWRELNTLEPYHDECKPQVMWN